MWNPSCLEQGCGCSRSTLVSFICYTMTSISQNFLCFPKR
ncbi:unnamed protein product [Brassica rapa]|uniref:Uncharacterized protein n=1 Tax=Brassica campestris TaxID=3711 RepID=A0A3P6CDX5_BRACM|nr:unnamed protein product [Brassica rapa]VDD16583.1 unnamed protein product [Brassica rapa]